MSVQENLYTTHYVLNAPKGATVNKVLDLLEAQGVKGGAYTIRTSERVAGDGSTMYGVTYTLLGLGDHESAFPPGSGIFRGVLRGYLCLEVESRAKPAGSPNPEKDKYDHFLIGLSEEWAKNTIIIPRIIAEVQKALSGR